MSAGDAASYKEKGNAALKSGNFEAAIQHYSKGIEIDPRNHVLYSNRSAAHASNKNYSNALADAEKCIEIKSDWPKGYSRKGSALEFMKRYEEAKMAYEEGLKFDKNNKQLLDGVKSASKYLTGPAGSQPLGSPFGDLPTMLKQLSSDPRTKDYLSQPDYLPLLQNLSTNPQMLSSAMGDPRIQNTLSVLLGIDFSAMAGGKDEPMDSSPSSAAPSGGNEKKEDKKEEEPAQADNVKKSIEEKNLGNAAYKKKDFETAISHYDKAFELDETNVTALTNKAAVYYEMGQMETCRETCLKAVDHGRDHCVDFKIIAKAYARIGNSYLKEENYKDAIKFYNKSLLENRTKDVLGKLQQCEKALAEAERLAYINPEIALEEKNKGNEEYRKGNYPEALKHYTESIKRNPDAAATYSNRAATYMKLVEFKLALKDCDTCIEKDPTFVKGHVRKGGSLEAMKEYSRANDAYKKALEIDPNNSEATDGLRRCMSNTYQNQNNPEEVQRRALNDPEVRRIMSDPAMKMILDQCQRDPNALREHIKDPKVASDIQKLMDVGILQVR